MQSWMRVFLAACTAGWIGVSAAAQSAQTSPPATVSPQAVQPGHVPGAENAQTDALGQFTPAQREQYDAAGRLFSAERFAEALDIFRPLLAGLPPGSPGQVLVAKFASEAAINTGDYDFAVRTLTPIEAADANDWQAAGLLARAYAEGSQPQKRDAELARLKDLHTRAVTPQIAKQQQVLLERIPEKNGSLRVWYSLEPWGRYRVYVYARVYNQAGQQLLRITLESSDFDQPLFAKEHPDLAARGQRRFSLDGYGEEQKLPNGQMTGSHMTFGFFDGEPAYDVVRGRMVQIAEQQTRPASVPVLPR